MDATVRYTAGGGSFRRVGSRHLAVVGESSGASYEADAVHPDEVLAALEHAVDLAARADLDRLGDRQLLEHTAAVDRQVTRLQAQQTRRLRAIEVRKAHLEVACVSTAGWLRFATNRDGNEASKLARVAGRLGWLDRTREALEAGEITFEHAATIARVATPHRRDAIVEAEDTLVALARHATPKDVYRVARKIADAVDRDASDGPCGPDPGRELFHARIWKGRGDLRASLDPVAAELFDALLDAYSTTDPDDVPPPRRRTPAQRRHDAFHAILRAAAQHRDAPTVHGAKPHVLVMMDMFTLLGCPDLATRTTRLGSGAEIDLERALHLLEDAKITPVLMAGPWRPVAVGRSYRTTPPWLRPVLQAIHPNCGSPGCDRPFAWGQAAHLDPWHLGGRTDLDRTIAPCYDHHVLMDIVGWKVDWDPDTGICTWTSPDGHTIIHAHPPDP